MYMNVVNANIGLHLEIIWNLASSNNILQYQSATYVTVETSLIHLSLSWVPTIYYLQPHKYHPCPLYNPHEHNPSTLCHPHEVTLLPSSVTLVNITLPPFITLINVTLPPSFAILMKVRSSDNRMNITFHPLSPLWISHLVLWGQLVWYLWFDGGSQFHICGLMEAANLVFVVW